MKTFATTSKLLLLGAMLSTAAFAQSPTGSIEGVVADSSGAVIPNAKITITNVATNETKTVSTDREGRFEAPLLPPGTYSVQAAAPAPKVTEEKKETDEGKK